MHEKREAANDEPQAKRRVMELPRDVSQQEQHGWLNPLRHRFPRHTGDSNERSARVIAVPQLASLVLAALLSGCGLQPLYSGGGSGAVATSLTRIEVAPIEGK